MGRERIIAGWLLVGAASVATGCGSSSRETAISGASSTEARAEQEHAELTKRQQPAIAAELAERGTQGGALSAPRPAGMVLVPGGTFTMGAHEGREDQRPVHAVTLSPYFIDLTEVTIASYTRCVDERRCSVPTGAACTWDAADWPERDNQPVSCVDWDQARSYCEFVGARLPTEAEWEYAARGADGRRFPWGNEPPAEGLVHWDSLADLDSCADESCARARGVEPPVGAFPRGASPFGVLDLAGSVWEWVADWYGPYPAGPVTDPAGPSEGTARVTRGGEDTRRVEWLEATYRSATPATLRRSGLGFRCARSARE